MPPPAAGEGEKEARHGEASAAADEREKEVRRGKGSAAASEHYTGRAPPSLRRHARAPCHHWHARGGGGRARRRGRLPPPLGTRGRGAGSGTPTTSLWRAHVKGVRPTTQSTQQVASAAEHMEKWSRVRGVHHLAW
jgi:hypothetical protein